MAKNNLKPLLEVKNLKTHFFTEDGVVHAVDGVDFNVYPGEILGLVGESGCGKSVTSLSVMRLVSPPGKILEGEMLLDNVDLRKLSEEEMMKVRGNRISMIFQQPQTALNPVFRVGDQIAEVLLLKQGLTGREAWEAAGYEVRGVALSGIAAENLESGSGISSRTIASMEHGWQQGRDLLTTGDVLVIEHDIYVGLSTRSGAQAVAQMVETMGGIVVGLDFVVELTFLHGRDKLTKYDVHSILKY